MQIYNVPLRITLPQGVLFYYGISPGQDMRYSQAGEVHLLLQKTRQLQQLGCKGVLYVPVCVVVWCRGGACTVQYQLDHFLA